MDCFQLELVDMAVDAEQRPFKLLNAVAGLTEETLDNVIRPPRFPSSVNQTVRRDPTVPWLPR